MGTVGTALTLEQQQLALQQQALALQQQQQALALAQQQAMLAAAATPAVVQLGVPSVQIGVPSVQIGMPSVQVGMTTVTAPPPPPPVKEEHTIWANFPDGCIVGFHYKINELELNGKIPTNNGRLRLVPARPASAAPSPPFPEEVPVVYVGEVLPTPVDKRGMMTKLGGSKTLMGQDSWQYRFFALNAKHLSYAKDDKSPVIDAIELVPGIEVRVIDAYTPARRNR